MKAVRTHKSNWFTFNLLFGRSLLEKRIENQNRLEQKGLQCEHVQSYNKNLYCLRDSRTGVGNHWTWQWEMSPNHIDSLTGIVFVSHGVSDRELGVSWYFLQCRDLPTTKKAGSSLGCDRLGFRNVQLSEGLFAVNKYWYAHCISKYISHKATSIDVRLNTNLCGVA
jgi:hypothetical protein